MKAAPLGVDGVFDLETEAWDRYVVGGALASDGTYFDSRSEDELFDWLLEQHGDWWAHNGGRFDALWFCDMAIRRGLRAQLSLAGARITCVRLGALRIRDSYALVPLALRDFATMTGQEKGETGLPCECGKACGGYCAIRRDMSPARFALVRAYLYQDCRCLRDALTHLFAWASDEHITLKGTIGGSAWATASEWCSLPKAEWDASEYYLARKGYYGGRCQVFRTRAESGYRYDLNSAYPHALTRPVPVGAPLVGTSARLARAFERELDGIYGAVVRVPEMTAPPLPVRLPTGRLCYPVGEVVGHWPRHELAHAVTAGAKIERFLTGIVWEASEPICEPFMDRGWALRHAVGKRSPLGKWCKLFLNSLTGKFAQDPEGERAIINPSEDEIRPCLGSAERNGHCTDDACSGKCRKWRAIDRDGLIYAAPSWRLPDCGHVQWAATLTAYTRVELHEQMTSVAGGTDVIYCDTDSCYASGQRTRRISPPEPNEVLGEWLYEGPMFGWEAVGPKAYRYHVLEADEHGLARAKPVIRCKGVGRISSADFDRYARGERIEKPGVAGFKTAARLGEGLFSAHALKRGSRAARRWAGDRIVEGDRTIPTTIRKILAERPR